MVAHPSPTAHVAPRTSIRRRIVMQAVILTAFVITVLTTISFIISRSLLERAVLTRVSSLSASAEDAVEDAFRKSRQTTFLLSSHERIQSLFEGIGSQDGVRALLADLQVEDPSLTSIAAFDENDVMIAGTDAAADASIDSVDSTVMQPIVTEDGWRTYRILSPVYDEAGKRIGTIVTNHSADAVLARMLGMAASLGESGEVAFTLMRDGEILLMHPSNKESEESYVLFLGEAGGSNEALNRMPVVRAMNGTEGVGDELSYDGTRVLTGYRFLPSLGWGLTVQVRRSEALAGVQDIAVIHVATGIALLILAVMLAWILADQLTNPLRALVSQVRLIRPGHWTLSERVHTGDEVEVLEHVIVDLASRLQRIYAHLEEEIAERTRELGKQYELDRTILDSIGQGVITVDEHGMITGANPAAITMLKVSADDIRGKKAADTMQLYTHRGNPMGTEHMVDICLEQRKEQRSPAQAHWSIRRNDGTLLPVMIAATPLFDGEKLFGAIVVFQDITEERRLDYMKSEFISLASHQLRTPLSALRWYVELMGEDKKELNDLQQNYLAEMDHALQRMVALLSSLLHAAHLEGEELKPDISEVDIVALMQEMEEDCRTMVHGAGLTCTLKAPAVPLTLTTDPTLLRVVMQNLISNAVKYSGKGKEVAMTLAHDAQNVIISVHDSGMGIPAAEQVRVFEKFFRATNVRKIDTDGNGLGLYITRSIVERLGGTIVFESSENKGTKFTVTLPLQSPVEHKSSAQATAA